MIKYAYDIAECEICHKEFIVERVLIGVDHTPNLIITHKECMKLPLPKDFIDEHPTEAKEIARWIRGD